MTKMWVKKWKVRSPLFCLLLQLLNISLFNYDGIVLADNDVQSSFIVKDPGGNDVGPRIELSSTVLKDEEELAYICREGTSAERNTLVRVEAAGVLTPVAHLDHVGGNIEGKVCNYDVDTTFWCTVNTGRIKWKAELGGRYCCSVYPDESYVIHWINPEAQVPTSLDYNLDVYGGRLRFYCAVDMTPTDISYDKIMKVTWQWRGAKTNNVWQLLRNNANKVKYEMSPTGSNSTLVISNYNPVLHGGDYRCSVGILRYDDPLQSEIFSITSQPKALLRNNKRDDFHFGLDEVFEITCYGQSYPFPSKIEFRIQAAVMSSNHPGIQNYEMETIALNVERHYAHFTITNASAVFPINDSVIECRVYRPDGKFSVAQVRVVLLDKAPPITYTENPIDPNVKTRVGEVTVTAHPTVTTSTATTSTATTSTVTTFAFLILSWTTTTDYQPPT